MDNKRTRKINYFYEIWDDNIITNLKLMECKYHIFGEEKYEKVLKGHIFFHNPKSINKIFKLFGTNCHISNLEFDINNYKNLENTWETGELPIQGRPKKTVKTTNTKETFVTNSIIEQNTSLIEHSKDICQFLMKQNQQLLEENKNLKQL